MSLGENQDLAQNDFSLHNLASQDSNMSDNYSLLNNNDFSSTLNEINQDFGTGFSEVNSESLLPEFSNFQHEQDNLSLSYHTFESQNMGLSSHHLEFNSSTTAAFNSDDKSPYTTIDNAGNIDLYKLRIIMVIM